MPVTIRTHPIPGEPWPRQTFNDAGYILRKAAYVESGYAKRRMQDSFSTDAMISPSTNGLVDAAVTAWNTHHHLVLRPDDIWVAVISQLGFYIDAHAEELRTLFVAHPGKKELTVEQIADPDRADYGRFARQMSDTISKNVNDPTLVPWIIPNFSTTTDTDRASAAVLLMGAMKKYFSYNFACSACGIPSVTLLGDRADWVDLQGRIDRIPELKGETIEFHRLLKPIARHMVLSFDEPASAAVLDFWRGIACWEKPYYMGSGAVPDDKITGWITTFCFWASAGHRNHFSVNGDRHCIDGVAYGSLDEGSKTAGWAAVPVKVVTKDLNGQILDTRECRMVAGSIGMRPGRHSEMGVMLDGPEPAPVERGMPFQPPIPVENPGYFDSYDLRKPPSVWQQVAARPEGVHPGAPPASEGLDAVQPYIGWWIFEGKETKSQRDSFY